MPSSLWDPFWQWAFSPEKGLSITGAFGHHSTFPSVFVRANEQRLGLEGDHRTVAGAHWVLLDIQPDSAPCTPPSNGAPPSYELGHHTWRLGRVAHQEALQAQGTTTNPDRVSLIGDIDGDGLLDGYVETEGNALTLPDQPSSAVIRFSRRVRSPAQLGLAKFAERVATNLAFEGYQCNGNLDNCRYDYDDDITGQPASATGAHAKYDDRGKALVDLNGDGLADAVSTTPMKDPKYGDWYKKYRIGYYAGDGTGTFACSPTKESGTIAGENLATCTGKLGPSYGARSGGDFIPPKDIALQGRTDYDTLAGSRPLYHDVNGDGYTDIIVPRLYEPTLDIPWRVYFAIWLNEEGFRFRRYCPGDSSGASCVGAPPPGLAVGPGGPATTDPFVYPAQPYVNPIEDVPAPNHGSFTDYRVTFADMNADGVDEIVVLQKGGYSVLGLNITERPGLLTSISNGYGGTTTFDYETYQHHIGSEDVGPTSSAQRNRLENVMYVVKSVTTSNGMSGIASRSSTTSYTYRKPAFDTWTRSLVGFGEVVSSLGGSYSTRRTFTFGECHLSAGCWRTSDLDPLSQMDGKLASEDVFLGETSVLRQTLYLYEERALPSADRPRRYAPLKRVLTRIFNDTPATATRQNVIVVERPDGKGGTTYHEEEVVLWTSGSSISLLKEVDHDPDGNVSEVRDRGQVTENGSSFDQVDPQILVTSTSWVPIDDRWMFRPAEVVRTDIPLTGPRHMMRYDYDTKGNVMGMQAELTGTVGLDRFHEGSSPGAPPAGPAPVTAPAPATASQDGMVTLKLFGRNARGQVTWAAGPFAGVPGQKVGPCAQLEYDGGYSHFARVARTGLTQAEAPWAAAGACAPALAGGATLSTESVYDRGFAVPWLTAGPHGDIGFVSFDAFGRVAAVTDPDPNTPWLVGAAPRVSVDYHFAADHVRAHMTSLGGAERYSYVDGLGSPLMALERTKAGAAPGWVASGVRSRFPSGMPHEVYEPFAYTGDPLSPTFVTPTSPRVVYGYDAYDRVTQVSDVTSNGSTVVAKRAYTPLSIKVMDAEGAKASGPNAGNNVEQYFDGHGRIHTTAKVTSNDTEYVSASFDALGNILSEFRQHNGPDSYARSWVRDSFGRVVINWEPNTRHDSHAWRYAYDDAGRLVGTSDSRGCGKNLHYDKLGRLLAEDYSPCLQTHAEYSAPNLVTGEGTEAFFQYDDGALGDPRGVPGTSLGRLVAVADRGAHDRFGYDRRGRMIASSRRVVRPGSPAGSPAARYADHWYQTNTEYDSLDRVTRAATGVDVPELLVEGESMVSFDYGVRGEVAGVGSSYGTLISMLELRADGRPTSLTYGDAGATKATFTYEPDARARLKRTLVERTTTPAIWSSPDGGGTPAAAEPVRQPKLMDSVVTYDLVGNPTSITDALPASAWPAGAKPRGVTATYDEDYRLKTVSYGAASDVWKAPFANDGGVPRVTRSTRMSGQQFAYDWRGNITSWTANDSGALYDQFLGTQEHGGVSPDPNDTHPDRLKRSTVAGNELVLTAFDAAGNLTDLLVKRPGACTGGVCNQRFVYEWDEVGQLKRAKRWDYVNVTASTPVPPSPPTGTPTFELTYAYARAARVLKTSQAAGNPTKYTLEVFPSLRVERTTYDDAAGDYVRTADVESGYLAGAGKVYYGGAGLPGAAQGRARVALFVNDRLGSASVLLDKRTSEVMEKIVVDANGNTESDYRPSRWNGTREPYRFTGKEEDVEVGLTYFGARYLSSNLRRWLSPDPLTIHGAAADTNPYAYVGGRTLAAVDPLGLDDCVPTSGGSCQLPGGGTMVATGENSYEIHDPPPPPPPPPVEVVGAVVEYAHHGVAHLPGGFTYTSGDAPRHLMNIVPTMGAHMVLGVFHMSGAMGPFAAAPGLNPYGKYEDAVVTRMAAATHVDVPDRGGKDITKGVVFVQTVLGMAAVTPAAGGEAAVAEGLEVAAEEGGTAIVDTGVGTGIRQVNFAKGLGHAMKNHLTGNGPRSLRTLDPGGSMEKWVAHIVRVATTESGSVRAVAGGEVMEATAPMALEGGGVQNVGVRMFRAAGAQTWRLTTVLTIP